MFAILLSTSILTAVASSSSSYECPVYSSIVQPSMANFTLGALEGVWYVLASNEPTLPSFCTCNVMNVTIDGGVDDKSRQWYHYKATSKCGPGVPFSATMKGWANASSLSSERGFLHENMAFLNHTIADLVPNMIFDYRVGIPEQGLPTVALAYACIGSVLGKRLFSFNLFSRYPSLSRSQITEIVGSANRTAGPGVFDLDGLRIVDHKAFSDCGISE